MFGRQDQGNHKNSEARTSSALHWYWLFVSINFAQNSTRGHIYSIIGPLGLQYEYLNLPYFFHMEMFPISYQKLEIHIWIKHIEYYNDLLQVWIIIMPTSSTTWIRYLIIFDLLWWIETCDLIKETNWVFN